MFGKPKGELVQPGWFFRALTPKDVPAVLNIIRAHDEEDAEWAEQTYRNRGHHGHWVLTQDKRVTGVSGYALAEGTDNAYWISWTYLDETCHGQGLGGALLERVLQKVQEEGARKVFVSTSDYEEGGQKVYANAMRLYESAGFQLEVNTPDFYDEGEAQLIYGLQLNPNSPPPLEEFGNRGIEGIALTRLFRIDETEDCAGLDWEFTEDAQVFSKDDLALKLDEARSNGARCVFVSFGSDLTQLSSVLQQCRLREAGRLRDFWANGIDDVRYVFQLK